MTKTPNEIEASLHTDIQVSERTNGPSESDDKKTHPGKPQFPPAPEGGTRAWFVAGGAAAIFFCTLGLSNSFGSFEEYYLTHQMQHESASKISWIGSLQSFLQFFAGMLGGPLFDRYGKTVSSSSGSVKISH